MCADVSICQEYELTNGSFVTADECQKTLSYYIYENSGVKKCLNKRECTNIIDYYADVSAKKCVSRQDCQSYAYTLNDGSSESKECVDEVGCSAKGKNYTVNDNRVCSWTDDVCDEYQTITNDCLTADDCKNRYRGYIYEKDGAKLCVTWVECSDSEYYIN